MSDEKIYGSMADLEAGKDVEYTTIPGYKKGEVFRIGSVTAGDIIEWSEANEGEAKRTAGLRLITKSLVSSEETGSIRYADDDKNIAVFRALRHKESERIVREILRFNGMTTKAEEETKKG